MTRAIFLIAAALALANAALVLGGAILLDSGTMLISAVVAGLFAVIAGLLAAINHHLARVRRLVIDDRTDPPASAQLRRSLGKLTLWLSVAALGVGLAMAIALTGVLQRLSIGTAVFG